MAGSRCTPDRTGEIHNGADDNASGTASIIEIARAAVAIAAAFRARWSSSRSLVRNAACWDRRHYASQPRVPIESTIAMLNLDMVGRARGAVDVSGLEVSPSMEADLSGRHGAAAAALKIKREGPGAGRSDDSNFIDRRIPAINFFTGFHPDYHRPGDDWEKIDAAGTSGSRRSRWSSRPACEPHAKPEFVAQ